MKQEVRDNLSSNRRELWRDGRIVDVFTREQIEAFHAENVRLRSTYTVPPFGSLNPYWPQEANK